ncbi:MAG: lysozyme [Caulobacter sp.]|nr:lysozyme [Caulobacter sp.]
MKPRHQVSRAAIELIKTFEGYRQKAAQLPDGRWTIGYGHTLTARQGAEVSAADAEALLMYDLIAVAHAVNEHSYTPLIQNQFDALCCFAFNVGVDNFRRSSVLRRVNEGQMLQAACAMEMWRKADFEGERIVIDALVRRRAAEKTLFLTPANGWIPAPSPVLAPKVDYDAVNSVPRQTPTAVRASMTGDRTSVVRDDTPQPRPVLPPEVPLASEIAAAGVGARLEQLLPEEARAEPEPVAAPVFEPYPSPEHAAEVSPEPEPEPVVAPVVEAAPAVEPEPEPYLEVEPEPIYPQPPPIVLGGSSLAYAAPDADFTLTPAPEISLENMPDDALRVALPEAANESGPGLFDVAPMALVLEGAPARPLMSEDHVRRLVQQDEMASMADFDPAFADTPIEPARIAGLPLLAMAVGGMALFAGGVAVGFTAADGDGLLSVRNVGWLLSVVGIGLTGGAIYIALNKFLGAPLDDEDETEVQETEVTEAEWQPQA